MSSKNKLQCFKQKYAKKRKAAALALIIAVVAQKNNQVNRRWWVRPWLQEKNEGIQQLVQEQFRGDPEQFKQFTRLSVESFEKLLNMIENRIQKSSTNLRDAIPARHKLIVSLRFLATGETYRSLMYLFRISESTISIFVPVVCRAIYEALKRTYLKVPNSTADWLAIANDFQTIWNLPNIVGALDGKHIIFQAPRSAGSTYYNYKGDHSIVLLALVDAEYNFIYVDVGVNGRVSDGGVFRQSLLATALIQNKLNLPEDKCLPGREKLVPYMIVADAAFPLSDRILKPYPFRNMTLEQRIFNYRLSRARRVVENAFGILANRFRILLSAINLSADKVQTITLACCALHNFIKAENPTATVPEEAQIHNTFERTLGQQGANRPRNYALAIREEFKDYVNNEGSVPWQYDI